jgi:hypothetical protein
MGKGTKHGRRVQQIALRQFSSRPYIEGSLKESFQIFWFCRSIPVCCAAARCRSGRPCRRNFELSAMQQAQRADQFVGEKLSTMRFGAFFPMNKVAGRGGPNLFRGAIRLSRGKTEKGETSTLRRCMALQPLARGGKRRV